MEPHLVEMKIDVLIPHEEGNFGVVVPRNSGTWGAEFNVRARSRTRPPSHHARRPLLFFAQYLIYYDLLRS